MSKRKKEKVPYKPPFIRPELWARKDFIIGTTMNFDEDLAFLSRKAQADSNYKFDNLMEYLQNPNFLAYAMGTVMKNKGALTKRPDIETSDEASLDKLNNVAKDIILNQFRFKPIRRIYIDKTGQNRNVNADICKLAKDNNLTPESIKAIKARTLSIPCFTDKIVQEALPLLLDAIYEMDFKKLTQIMALDPS